MRVASAKAKSKTVNSNFFQFIKGLIVSLIITFAAIIIFALIIKWANLSDSVITPVNLVIKAIAIAFGTIIFAKSGTGGLKKGLIFAVSYITLAFVVFSALSGAFSIGISLLLDYVFGAVVGAVVGIIKVNRKKSV